MATRAAPTPLFEALIHHLVLPPRLPGREDRNEKLDYSLITCLINACRFIKGATNNEKVWQPVLRSIQTARVLQVNSQGKLNKTSLLSEFRNLDCSVVLIIYILEQNAALLISRQQSTQGERVVFEAFEASASAEDVLASENALQRDFPGVSVSVPLSTFEQSSFLEELAVFLEQASTEPIKMFSAKTNKAGSLISENRDTQSCELITTMLMALLEANGRREYPNILRKRIRDDVCWSNAESPWRRSPLWLVMRVSIQRQLCGILDGELGRVHYKFLMCIVLAQLLNQTIQVVSIESLSYLKTKLARRLAKLETDESRASLNARPLYAELFIATRSTFQNALKAAGKFIDASWANFKLNNRRPVISLPRRAAESDLYLSLPNSGQYLQQIMAAARQPSPLMHNSKSPPIDIAAIAQDRIGTFSHRYLSLCDIETGIEVNRTVPLVLDSNTELETRCTAIAREIKMYLHASDGAYVSNPEQSSLMILSIMELWMTMDKACLVLYPLLKHYHPYFSSEMLDVLHLPLYKDMIRLQKIQEYLRKRQKDASGPNGHMTIFEDPIRGCFAERHFNESADSLKLQELMQRIEDEAALARNKKETEYERINAEYDRLTKLIAESACVFTVDNFQVRSHDDRQCTKCYNTRKARRLRITVYEHPLPSNIVQAKVVVFELSRPKAFSLYRSTTWKIISSLASSKQVVGLEPIILLKDYQGLKSFVDGNRSGFSLGSTTKSFLMTHYGTLKFPVSQDDLFRPNGLKLAYYDEVSQLWPARQKKGGFLHHFHFLLPAASPFSQLMFLPTMEVGTNGPSSYEVLASQSKTPSGINIHEYMAFQSLLSGKTRRLVSLLRELGSQNLNFGTESMSILVFRLVHEAGPVCEDGDSFRVIHKTFRDEQWCMSMIEQLSFRLEHISSNGRENFAMDTILTLVLRLMQLGSPTTAAAASSLLEKARKVTELWLQNLRAEVSQATDADIAKRCSRYALWAALLCRRTFSVYIHTGKPLDCATLRSFIECSITLQDNLTGDPAQVPLALKNAIIRDLKAVHKMRFLLQKSLEASPEALMLAVDSVWPKPEGSCREISSLHFLDCPEDLWIQATIDAKDMRPQTIHYHIFGHLLIDGKPLGQLPIEYRTFTVLKELFGDTSLLTYPSALPGSTFTLNVTPYGHQIHLGLRRGSLVVRALVRNTILELIPREVFQSTGPHFDLPNPLVRNCVHWLDLNTGILEIRQKPAHWISKESNWKLNVRKKTAYRRFSRLVDPCSSTFRRVFRIFQYFEDDRELVVFQPQVRNLSVELKRLSLSFVVNGKKLLESSQLRAEIDSMQDCGTWYGLRSKIILRDTANPRHRSIIVPMCGTELGGLKYRTHGIHVDIIIFNTGTYGRYFINDVLGRLECPAEPWLLYNKALLFALTSFILPDPLTGRTGTEEAISCLRSGLYQPWTPLNISPYSCLLKIAKLSPKREYYPQDGTTMQRVFWEDQLTTCVQYDGYRSIVKDILDIHEKLNRFVYQNSTACQSIELPKLASVGEREAHLVYRSYARLSLFTRYHQIDGLYNSITPDPIYNARDGYRSSQRRTNVLETSNLILRWPQKICTAQDLSGIMQNFPNITGFVGKFDQILLSTRLSPDYASDFSILWNMCQSMTDADKYRLQFLFSLLGFGAHSDVDMQIIRCLIACCVFQELKVLTPPSWPSYVQFRQNQNPQTTYLVQLLKPCRIPYGQDARSDFKFSLHAKQRRALEAAEAAYEKQTDHDCQALANFLLKQWPCAEPSIEGFSDTVQINMAHALEIIRPEWERLFRNLELSNYLKQVQDVLTIRYLDESFVAPKMEVLVQEVYPSRCRGGEFPVLSDLMLRAGPELSQSPKQLSVSPEGKDLRKNGHYTSREIMDLEKIIKHISDSTSVVRRTYGHELMLSLDSFKMFEQIPKHDRKQVNHLKLADDINAMREIVAKARKDLCSAFSQGDPSANWLKDAGLWPCVSTVALLEHLRSTAPTIGDRAKQALLDYALKIIDLQRLLRLEVAFQKGDYKALVEEQNNLGHSNWEPSEEPDWVLLEIESNILIRPDQLEVARATISPASESNSVLQLNMGQGKTSVVIPMVALKLADSKSLMRVIIPKSLLLQTAQLLQGRLGGLLGRSILHLPFSRKTKTNHETTQLYFTMHKECILKSGIVLALPEHLLSFQLSGLQGLSDGRINEGVPMVKIQRWIESKSRDVIDESDQILGLRTQLIYPSGAQKAVDGSPHRWETAQTLLHLVESHLFDLQDKFPHSLEVIPRKAGGYPMFFFLRKDVEEALLHRIVVDICNGRTPILSVAHCTKSDRLAIKQFLTEPKVKDNVAKQIRHIFPDKPALKQNLFLLRGLLIHRIFLLTLKKRWQVQYGLSPERDPIAVPFTAKGWPSEQAEWGHPDVAIILTCLAFYYDGLNLKQFKQALEHVLKSDDPASQYDRWTSSNIPDSLREWNSINLEDEMQMIELWGYLSFSIPMIDYYLNNFAFPAHAKQLAVKLQASGWDIPLTNTLTTGFSGTNDTRNLLPETIKQQDLPGLSHTNAEVLTYLLQERNRRYVLAADDRGRHISEDALLRTIQSMGIRILIDAGAQILEMDNAALAKAWLDIDYAASASCYIDNTGKIMVFQRGCRPIPLLASPYAENLGEVLVFIDEAHCRGLDLKFPTNAVGALTLGPGQSKDQTVQASMRLRQLATTQSIVFISPPEVHQSILDVTKKSHNDWIDSYDVVCWLLEQTCQGIEQLQPLYYSQGIDFCRRMQAADDYSNFLTDAKTREMYLDTLRQKEAQTLEDLYGVKVKSKPVIGSGTLTPKISGYVKKLNLRRRGFRDDGTAVNSSALQEVEQEREVAYEVEAVREVQKPVHYPAFTFLGLDKDILTFAKTGRLPADSTSYEHVFLSLRKSGIGIKFGISNDALGSRLFCSQEFLRTVKVTGRTHDNFMRSVNWILWSTVTESALIVNDEEAELLIPVVRNAKAVASHLLIYAAPVTRRMLHFNDLKYYAIPSLPLSWTPPMWFIVELSLFAGGLYFEFRHYEYLCKFLGFEPGQILDDTQDDSPAGSEEEPRDNPEGNRPEEPTVQQKSDRVVFTAKPLTFLQEWLTNRRKGQDFTYTPMGYLCKGKPLTASHPFFSKQDPDSKSKITAKPFQSGTSGTNGYSNGINYNDDELDDDDGAWAEMGNEHVVIDGEESDSESEYFSPDDEDDSNSSSSKSA